MDIEIKLASYEEKSILRNLMELAQYDYSEYDGSDVDEHGLYGYKFLDHYWTDADRYPFLVRVSGKLAGFALVRVYDKRPDDSNIYSIGEFCILKKYRQQGIGRKLTAHIFSMFKGGWTIQTCDNNRTAQKFWAAVAAPYESSGFRPHRDRANMVELDFEVT
ncbi:MAG: acetyltransferase [Paenibacillus sp.]|jgi:predicted acetyltransferase|nr:acetyltransferase [Paenibacillus sp.]